MKVLDMRLHGMGVMYIPYTTPISAPLRYWITAPDTAPTKDDAQATNRDCDDGPQRGR